LVKRTKQSKERVWCDLLQTHQSTGERTDEQRVKATSETHNQAVPNTDTASTAVSAAAAAAAAARTRTIASVTEQVLCETNT